MNSKDYQAWVTEPASGGGSRKFPGLRRTRSLTMNASRAPGLALGLAGEAGEVADVIKKGIRDHNTLGFDFNQAALLLELGDVLWYLVGLADSFGWTLEDIMQANFDKIESRRAQKAGA